MSGKFNHQSFLKSAVICYFILFGILHYIEFFLLRCYYCATGRVDFQDDVFNLCPYQGDGNITISQKLANPNSQGDPYGGRCMVNFSKILVEGKSTEIYLRATMAGYSPSLAILENRVENPGGWSEIDTQLGELKTKGQGDSVFVIWDQDVLEKLNGMAPANLIEHPLSYPFQKDFEELFPDWMITEALLDYDPEAEYPSEVALTKFCRVSGSEQPFYERLRACVKTYAQEHGQDPATVNIPSKVQLAECLAKIAKRTRYQPEEMRRLMNRLVELTKGANESWNLIENGVVVENFVLNSHVISKWKLKGKIALSLLPDVWLMNLNELTLSKIVVGIVRGPPCWSYDGSQIVFPSEPSQYIRNGDAICIYDLNSGKCHERLRIGHYLCWDKHGLIYGNSFTSDGYQVHTIDPKKPGYRRALPLVKGSLVSCVDRKRDRILIGEQCRFGSLGKRVCSIFRINDGELVWDGATTNIALAEWTKGAFSPDGNKISWPVEERISFGASSIWITNVDTSKSIRITPPGGTAHSSCWSPNAAQLAFMWARWPGDQTRMWIYDLDSKQLEPLLEGPFGGSSGGLGALGCHSWAQID